MFKPFDIFRIADGEPVWIASASELKEAHALVVKLSAERPGGYLIFSHHMGEKIFEKAGVPDV
jgi:hypothetical protein